MTEQITKYDLAADGSWVCARMAFSTCKFHQMHGISMHTYYWCPFCTLSYFLHFYASNCYFT